MTKDIIDSDICNIKDLPNILSEPITSISDHEIEAMLLFNGMSQKSN